MFSSPAAVAYDIFDWIFRLSFLRLNVPLTEWHLTEARGILANLERWQPVWSYSEPAQQHLASLPTEVIQMAELYRCACLIFAHKVIDPDLTQVDATIRSYICQGIDLLDTIAESKLGDTSLMIWPIFILGLAASTKEEQSACQRPLQYLLSTCGIGCTQGILDLLHHAWEDQSGTGSNGLGLDILFRDDLLSQIIF